MKKNDTWFKCTVCGCESPVGRCCGEETRLPLNKKAKEVIAKIKTDKINKIKEAMNNLNITIDDLTKGLKTLRENKDKRGKL